MKKAITTIVTAALLFAGAVVMASPTFAAPVNTVDRLPGVAKTVQQAKKQIKTDLRNDYFHSKRTAIYTLKFLGFSPKVSKKAVNSMSINYNEQAAKQANYHVNEDKYSTVKTRSDLIKALREWSKFTKKQARYGANAVGL